MKIKRSWMLLAICLLVAFGAVVTLAIWPSNPPDPATQSPDQIAKYIASKKFARLDQTEKQNYLSQTGRGLFRSARGLSNEERQKMRENIGPLFRRQMEARVDRYLELPPEERTAHLDEMIDRMEAMRQAMPEQPSGPRPGRRGFTPERMKRMLENTPPESRAKFVEFMKDFRQRMNERGISPP